MSPRRAGPLDAFSQRTRGSAVRGADSHPVSSGCGLVRAACALARAGSPLPRARRPIARAGRALRRGDRTLPWEGRAQPRGDRALGRGDCALAEWGTRSAEGRQRPREGGARQGSCRLVHAAMGWLWPRGWCSVTTESRSGLRETSLAQRAPSLRAEIVLTFEARDALLAGVERAHRLRRSNAGELLAQGAGGMGVPMASHRARIDCSQPSASSCVINRLNGGRSRVKHTDSPSGSANTAKPPSTPGVDPGMF